MTTKDRNIKLKHLITCMKCEVSGKACDENCSTQYEAGNMGEIIENLEAISEILEQKPCEDCISKQSVDTLVDELARAISDERCYISRGRSTGIIMQDILDLPPVPPKQQTCEDAVSRQEAIKLIQKYGIGCFDAEEFSPEQCERFVISKLNSLQPVTPKEKKGKWIMHPKGIYAHLVCNKCLSSAPYNCQTNYCPNCGARMVSE